MSIIRPTTTGRSDISRIAAEVSAHVASGIFLDATLLDLLDVQVRERGNVEAVLDARESLTFAELRREIDTTAAHLIGAGIMSGQLVLVQMPNSADYLKVLFGCMVIGAVPVLMLISHRHRELLHVARITGATAIITVDEHLGVDHAAMACRVAEELAVQVLVVGDRVPAGARALYATTPGDLGAVAGPTVGDTALCLLSGGTTSKPKVIPRLHGAYACVALASARRCQVTPDDTYLAVLSTSHDYPLSSPGVLGVLLNGGRVIMSVTASFDEVANWLETEEVTLVQAVPAVAAAWAQAAEQAPADLRAEWHIPTLVLGAAKVGTELASRLVKIFGCRIIQGYGLGEGITCFTSPDDPDEIAWNTQGTPVSDQDEVRILDPQGNVLGPGEVGELVEKGPYTFHGYMGAPELNAACFDNEGFFHTGDQAMIRHDGRVVITGRVHEQINRAGENVIPSEVESLVAAHPDVNEVAVFGIPDPEMGEATCAVVTVFPGREQPTRATMAAFLHASGVGAYKVPDRLVVVRAMPRKNIGKIDKLILRSQILGGAEAAGPSTGIEKKDNHE